MATLIQRQFVALSIITAFLFIVTSVMAMHGNRVMIASSAVQQAAARVSSLALLTWMGQEIPTLTQTVQASTERGVNSISGFLFQVATGIQPGDLRSLLGRELPGMLTADDARFVVAGKDSTLADLYVEYPAYPHQVNDAARLAIPVKRQQTMHSRSRRRTRRHRSPTRPPAAGKLSTSTAPTTASPGTVKQSPSGHRWTTLSATSRWSASGWRKR